MRESENTGENRASSSPAPPSSRLSYGEDAGSDGSQFSSASIRRLYNVPPSTIMGSCRGCSSIQLPFGLFLCLLSEAKQHRKTGACIIRKSFLIYLYVSDMIFPKNDPIAL
ncbi:hypothetical protein Lal_00001856 [Lupinus albus]|nr:hypothetical protein Lal_00001856 [Lupinus albus]